VRLGLSLCGLALLIGALLGPARSAAAAEPQSRLTALAGSNSYLVYARFPVQPNGVDARVGGLFVMDRSGKTRKLASIPLHYETPSLAGNILLVPTVAASTKFELINLRTGRQKMLSYKSHVSVLPAAAAPDGYLGVVAGSSPSRIVRVSWSGARTNFGAPFSDCRDVEIETGPTGFLALGAGDASGESNSCFANDGGVKSALFNKPGKYFTLEASDDSFGCSTTGPTHVTCASSFVPCHVKIYSLKGHVTERFVTSQHQHCPGQLTIASNHAFWFTPAAKGARLFELDNGKLTQANGYFPDQLGPVGAFGKVVVPETGRHHLLDLTSAHATPHRLL
jgi:hypothetical protein